MLGLQELNLCYKYGTIYWSTANLIVDSGAYNEESNDSTNYGKMATAIATMQYQGTDVTMPLINSAEFGFKVDAANNRIIFSLKGMNGIGTEVVQDILQKRPFTSMEDFAEKMLLPHEDQPALIKKSKMIQLIKGGCFTELHSKDRQKTMHWYLKNYVFVPCEKLGMQQYNRLKDLGVLPASLELAEKMINFKKYVLSDEHLYEKHINPNRKIPKKGYHEGYYLLDVNSQPFFQNHFSEESIVGTKGEFFIVGEKKFTKEVDSMIQPIKDWMSSPESLDLYNQALYDELWNEHASGSLASWSMSALSYYDKEHELEHVQEDLYGIVNYFNLPEEPEPYDFYTRYIQGKQKFVPKFKISRIAGTVLNADNNHHMVTLLTKYGVVNVKFNKGHYAFYNKRISAPLDENSDKKTVLENSWFKRGSLIAIAGIRRGDQFIPMIYKDTIYKHTVNLIQEIYEDGTLLLQSERTKI